MPERVILTIGTRKGLFVAESPKSRGKFVLRVEPALHRRLAAKALAAGESLNSYCVKTLVKA